MARPNRYNSPDIGFGPRSLEAASEASIRTPSRSFRDPLGPPGSASGRGAQQRIPPGYTASLGGARPPGRGSLIAVPEHALTQIRE